MRRQFLTKYLWVVLVMGLTSSQFMLGIVNWTGNVTADALASVDPQVDIIGNVLLGDLANANVEVFADTADMVVNVVGANRVITANDSIGTGGEKGLNFRANAGFTVTLNLDFSLEFLSDNQNFVVSFSGAGNFVVRLADGTIFKLSGNAVNATGTYFLVNMDITTNTPNAQDVYFTRQNQASNTNVEIQVGTSCVMGFMGTDTTLATETAIIALDASNNVANSGRMIIRASDGGAVAMQGYQTANTTTPLASNINFSIQAGAAGTLEVKSAGLPLWSGLLAISENTVLPDFRSNPWCSNTNLDGNGELTVGIQPGFVLGKNGVLDIGANAYFDYIAAASNVSPTPTIPAAILNKFTVNGVVPQVDTLVKDRNPSAFMVDGPASQCSALPVPVIKMYPPAKIYFRSAVDGNGTVATGPDYLVDPRYQLIETQGNGSIVFDVEGVLNIEGDPNSIGTNNSAINILSLQEAATGGSVLIEGSETVFKLRPDPWNTTIIDGVTYYDQYGKACAFINGRINLNTTAIQHTDEIHKIFDKNILQQSEPTYIGGESFKLCEDRQRPHIMYYDSDLLLHTSAAFTGVDQATPSLGTTAGANSADNYSDFVFYHNGYALDQGTGRSLILGTNIGALASDLGTIVDRDSHFDNFQEFDQAQTNIVSEILTRPNNNKVQEGAPADQSTIASEYSVHSFFLGHGTNVSLGTNATVGTDPCTQAQFNIVSNSVFYVNGDFISMETQGGILNKPETSVITGQGGIFVDTNGIFELNNSRRMSIGTMIATGFNGIVDLRGTATFYDERIGITRSNLDLSDVAQQTIIPAGTLIPDFTLDWKYTTRDGAFVPYAQPNTPAVCQCPAPVVANITGLPIVAGEVDQLQIYNSRLGDPAHVLVSGGKVRELVFETSDDSGVAPVAIVVMTNDGTVGIGSAGRNNDSPQANAVLGINGVSLMADGNCHVILNEDALINNVCHFLAGPNFGAQGVQKMIITSEVPRELRVRSGATFDLSGFNTTNKVLEIDEQVSVVFEPGSRLITGGSQLIMSGNSSLNFEPVIGTIAAAVNLASTDTYRVKVSGTGGVLVEEDASINIPRGALVGIESGGVQVVTDSTGIDQGPVTIVDCPYVTNLTWTFEDAAKLYIGGGSDYGGGLQVGNTVDQSENGGAVTFNLILNGIGTELDLNSQGFLGLGVGIVSKSNSDTDSAPNNWVVAPTFNTVATNITITEGIFKHNQIYTGSDINASLIAYGAASTGHSFALNTVTPQDARLLGGGNMVLTTAQGNPTVLTTDSSSVGILSSRPTLDDSLNTVPAFPAAAASIFSYLKANAFESQSGKYAQAFQSSLGVVTIGYVDGTTIVRDSIVGVRGNDGAFINPARSLELGAFSIALSTNNDATCYAIRN